MDYAKINEAAMGYKDDMTKFLRDLVRIPGESCGEKGHIMRIKEEMEKVGFDKVQIDPMEQVKLSLVLTLILIQSVSVISRTGNLIHTKVSNLMKKSADVEHLTRWAVLFLQYTVLRS